MSVLLAHDGRRMCAGGRVELAPVLLLPRLSDSAVASPPAAQRATQTPSPAPGSSASPRVTYLTLRAAPAVVARFAELSSQLVCPTLPSVRALLLLPPESAGNVVSFRALVLSKELLESDQADQYVCVGWFA